MIYVATDKGRIKNTASDSGAIDCTGAEKKRPPAKVTGEYAVSAGRGRRQGPCPKSPMKPRRDPDVPQVEQREVCNNEEAAEPNPWPEALALAGQVLPVRDRFLAMSRDCRHVAVATQTDLHDRRGPRRLEGGRY